MSRKVVQLTATGVENNIQTQCNVVFAALCDDGTVWMATDMNESWSRMPDIPQEGPAASPAQEGQ